MNSLSEFEIERYGRQLILSGWSIDLQSKLKQVHVHLPIELLSAGIYLAAAGVGSISLTGDAPSTNQTQLLVEHLQAFNPSVSIANKIPAGAEAYYRIRINSAAYSDDPSAQYSAEVLFMDSLIDLVTCESAKADELCLLTLGVECANVLIAHFLRSVT